MKNAKISILIKKSSIVFDKLANQLLTPYDLTGSQFKILLVLYLAPNGTVRQTDIEEKFSVSNPTVTGLVHKLEAKDLVKRTPHNDDKRSKLLVLTERAMAMKDELLSLADSLEQQMTEKLTSDECEQLAMLLEKLFS